MTEKNQNGLIFVRRNKEAAAVDNAYILGTYGKSIQNTRHGRLAGGGARNILLSMVAVSTWHQSASVRGVWSLSTLCIDTTTTGTREDL